MNYILIKLFIDCWWEIDFFFISSPCTPPLINHTSHTPSVGCLLEWPEEDGFLENIKWSWNDLLCCWYHLHIYYRYVCGEWDSSGEKTLTISTSKLLENGAWISLSYSKNIVYIYIHCIWIISFLWKLYYTHFLWLNDTSITSQWHELQSLRIWHQTKCCRWLRTSTNLICTHNIYHNIIMSWFYTYKLMTITILN